MNRFSSFEEARQLITAYEKHIKNLVVVYEDYRAKFRARGKEIGMLREALKFYKEDDERMVEAQVLESLDQRPATKVLNETKEE